MTNGNFTDAYTISPDGKTVTLNSADAIPAGRDGPDEHLRRRLGRQRRPGRLGGGLQPEHVFDDHLARQDLGLLPAGELRPHLPDAGQPIGAGRRDENQQLGVGNLFPYLDVGLTWAALQFTTAPRAQGPWRATSRRRPTAPISTLYTQWHRWPTPTAAWTSAGAAPPHRQPVFLILGIDHTANPNSAGFPYTTGTTANPNGMVNYVTIDGSLTINFTWAR